MLNGVTENPDWDRQARFYTAGIKAVWDISTQIGTEIKIILHISLSEIADWWFDEATRAGITELGTTMADLRQTL
jgi:hypothetical protein